MFKVKLTPQGTKDLKKLPKDLQRRVIRKIDFFSKVENPILLSKPLVNLPPSTHRFRVGDYRVAFFIKKDVIYIDRIGHRKEVYLHNF